MDLLVERASLARWQAHRTEILSQPAYSSKISIDSVVQLLLDSYVAQPHRVQGRKAQVYARLANVPSTRISCLLQSRRITVLDLLEDGLITSLEKCPEFSLKETSSFDNQILGLLGRTEDEEEPSDASSEVSKIDLPVQKDNLAFFNEKSAQSIQALARTGWASIPGDCLERVIAIGNILDAKSLTNIGGVCRNWRTIANQDHIWKKAFIRSNLFVEGLSTEALLSPESGNWTLDRIKTFVLQRKRISWKNQTLTPDLFTAVHCCNRGNSVRSQNLRKISTFLTSAFGILEKTGRCTISLSLEGLSELVAHHFRDSVEYRLKNGFTDEILVAMKLLRNMLKSLQGPNLSTMMQKNSLINQSMLKVIPGLVDITAFHLAKHRPRQLPSMELTLAIEILVEILRDPNAVKEICKLSHGSETISRALASVSHRSPGSDSANTLTTCSRRAYLHAIHSLAKFGSQSCQKALCKDTAVLGSVFSILSELSSANAGGSSSVSLRIQVLETLFHLVDADSESLFKVAAPNGMFQSFVCRLRHASISCTEIELILKIISCIPIRRKRRRSEFDQPPPPLLSVVNTISLHKPLHGRANMPYAAPNTRHPLSHPLTDARSTCQSRIVHIKKPFTGSSFSAPIGIPSLSPMPQDAVREIPSIVTDAIKLVLPKLERHLRRSKTSLGLQIKLATGCEHPEDNLLDVADQLLASQLREQPTPSTSHTPSSSPSLPILVQNPQHANSRPSSIIPREFIRQLSEDVRLYDSTVALARTLLQHVRVVSYCPSQS